MSPRQALPTSSDQGIFLPWRTTSLQKSQVCSHTSNLIHSWLPPECKLCSSVAGGVVESHFVQNGVQCSFETGKLAPLSDGSCLVKCGRTWVLASISCTEGFKMRERTRPNLTVSAELWCIPTFDASHVCCVCLHVCLRASSTAPQLISANKSEKCSYSTIHAKHNLIPLPLWSPVTGSETHRAPACFDKQFSSVINSACLKSMYSLICNAEAFLVGRLDGNLAVWPCTGLMESSLLLCAD